MEEHRPLPAVRPEGQGAGLRILRGEGQQAARAARSRPVTVRTRYCDNCLFFDAWADLIPPELEHKHGLCRIDPPTIGSDGKAVWPAVTENDWCGKHEAEP